jgi:polysaccharide deacetylase family protein (PEP-CTERM system associated)
MTAHALTIDLEDWHHLVYRHVTGETIQPTQGVIVDTLRLLDLLDQTKTRATFFVAGHVAEAYPRLVREVAARGHEIGSHTFKHGLIYNQTPAEFREDVARSIALLQDLIARPILGFRAPEFSVCRLDHWCFEILAQEGFQYDSSVVPLARVRYGIPGAPRYPFPIDTPSGTIREFPLATWNVGGRRLPVGGGSYFRLWPSALVFRALADLDAEGLTTVLYFHPYEFHRGWLYLRNISRAKQFSRANLRDTVVYNFNTGSLARRLRALLDRYYFKPLGEIFNEQSVAGHGSPALRSGSG